MNFIKDHKWVFITALVFLLLNVFSYCAGRAQAPAKVVTQEKIVYQDKIKVETKVEYKDRVVIQKVYVKVKDKDIKTTKTTTETTNKDGSKVVVTKETTENKEHTDTTNKIDTTKETTKITQQTRTEDKSGTTEKKTEITNVDLKWRGAVMVGINGQDLKLKDVFTGVPPMVYGVELDHKLIGPIWAGAWLNTTKQAGLSISLTF